MANEKKVFAARFNQPVQFIGVEGVDETRVFSGLVEDVPAEVADTKAFGIYKESGWVEVQGELKAAPTKTEETDPDLEGNVAAVLERAKDLSKDQLVELKAKEEKAQNRKGVVNGIDELIAAKG
jgi:hypothetical protein